MDRGNELGGQRLGLERIGAMNCEDRGEDLRGQGQGIERTEARN